MSGVQPPEEKDRWRFQGTTWKALRTDLMSHSGPDYSSKPRSISAGTEVMENLSSLSELIRFYFA